MKKKLIPRGAKPHNNHLAEGEATGHYHAAVAPDVQVWEYDGGLILDAPSGTEVTHQEHKSILIPPGVFDRSIVQEYDHFAEEAREVVD
ncbi:MAG TPA: hypothetical protein VGB17_15630 [Pyrinomonadaceae bacterium]|jgi:uncharacterized protein YjlB